MRQFFLSFLLIVTAAVSLKFGGMVFMNHGAGMMMSDDGCAFGAGSHDGERSGVDCVPPSPVEYGARNDANQHEHPCILLIVVAALFGFSFKRGHLDVLRNDNDAENFFFILTFHRHHSRLNFNRAGLLILLPFGFCFIRLNPSMRITLHIENLQKVMQKSSKTGASYTWCHGCRYLARQG